jgi:spermidine/putrescine transport system ATP-binding protein
MLKVQELYKDYEGQPLLRGVSFSVATGETVCLLGASGSGKSTLLRIITGLETADSGQVRWDGRDLVDVPVHRRNFGLMFQDYALFPHRTVAQNVAFGLRMQGLRRDQIAALTRQALAQVNLTGFDRRKVTDLSGGEQQRVALARALAPRPRLLMLDEPLGALDRALREQLLQELRRILHQTGIPAIYVTHDQEEAFAIADRLVLLHNGLVEQEGTPAEIHHHPGSAWVARFFGLGTLTAGEVVQSTHFQVETPLGPFGGHCSHRHAVGERVTLLLRPSGRVTPRTYSGSSLNHVTGRVEDVTFQGDHFKVSLKSQNGQEVVAFLPQAPVRGEAITLEIPEEEVVCLGKAEEQGG